MTPYKHSKTNFIMLLPLLHRIFENLRTNYSDGDHIYIVKKQDVLNLDYFRLLFSRI
jgi:hypothetical protein